MKRADSLERNLMLGKTEGGRRRGRQRMMLGWHHQLDGREFEPAPGDGDGPGSLACCSPWGRRDSDTVERLNGTENAMKAEEKQRWNVSKPQATSLRKVLPQNFSHIPNHLSNFYHLSQQIIRDFSKLQKPKKVKCHRLAQLAAVV